MKLDTPRVPPLDEAELDDEIRGAFGDGPVLNIFRTLGHHPKLMKRWNVFGGHILAKNSLPARDRELIILRIGWLCGAEYEWAQHSVIGRMSGLTDEEIERIAEGPEAPGWDEFDRVQLRAVDELRHQAFISDAQWEGLAARYDTRQLLDFIFTVGQYQLVSMALNTLGVPLEDGLVGFPEGRIPSATQ